MIRRWILRWLFPSVGEYVEDRMAWMGDQFEWVYKNMAIRQEIELMVLQEMDKMAQEICDAMEIE